MFSEVNQKNHIEKHFKKSYREEILETIHENDHVFKYHLDRFKYDRASLFVRPSNNS